mmetsp:Transcript_37574/g.57560  ORF Transcript_37574/g.57560 Transcript_37574/m.57560 type:complete len:155 (+) Transcript_37574:237-701(+)
MSSSGCMILIFRMVRMTNMEIGPAEAVALPVMIALQLDFPHRLTTASHQGLANAFKEVCPAILGTLFSVGVSALFFIGSNYVSVVRFAQLLIGTLVLSCLNSLFFLGSLLSLLEQDPSAPAEDQKSKSSNGEPEVEMMPESARPMVNAGGQTDR